MGRADAGIPDPVPGPDELERDVGEVVDRPVHVALEVESQRERSLVQRLAGGDPVRADHAGDPDVDDPRVGDVEGDPGQDERADADREPADRGPRHERPLALARPQAGDQAADEEVPEHRIGQRHRGGDLGAVEEVERQAQAQQHEQVEVNEPPRPPRVEERRDEQQAEREPDPRRVDRLRDRAVVAAGERRLDLEVAPGLVDLPVVPSTTT